MIAPAPYKEPDRRCEECIWWKEEKTSDEFRYGMCHFYPPKGDYKFPKTWYCDWCSFFYKG